jgi:glutaredoxin 3
MAKITVYTSVPCPYCAQAKRLLDKKGAAYEEIDISRDDKKRDEMIQRTKGRMSVPQIFIGDFHVGGSDDLHALERSGKLDDLLNADA